MTIDCNHNFGSDLSLTATGDIAVAQAPVAGQQRVLRRLLTNPLAYIFHSDYGAGLPAYVGKTRDIPKVTARIRGQMLLEDVVARTPAPAISVVATTSGVSAVVQYTDQPSRQAAVLQFQA